MAHVRAEFTTYADLQRMPEDGRQYELYDGEIRVVPSPTNRHQVVLMNLLALFLEYRERRGGRLLSAPSDVVFSEINVLQPDLLYFTERRRDCAARNDEVVAHPVEFVRSHARLHVGSDKIQRFRREASGAAHAFEGAIVMNLDRAALGIDRRVTE